MRKHEDASLNSFFEQEYAIAGPGSSSWINAQRAWIVILTNRAESVNVLDKLAIMVNGKYFDQWYKEVVER